MVPVLNIARSSCRGALFQVIRSKGQVLGSCSQIQLFQNSNFDVTHKFAPLFSTAQTLAATASHTAHSHSKTWTAERFLSASLLGILPLAIAVPSPILDYSLALAMTAHVHWGIEAIVVDYIRPSVVGATLSRAAVGAVYALSVFTLGGLFYFNYSDVGLGQAIRMFWKL